MNSFDISVHYFLQLAFILAVCRGVGLLAKYVGQTQVVGEMIAGIVMGPSLLGVVWPEAKDFLFPPAPQGLPYPAWQPVLFSMSQVGLALYMFLIGVEFRVDLVRERFRSAVSVSAAGIIAPSILGALIGWWLSKSSGVYFSEKAGALECAFFMAAAMSITAFPMLARIIYERGIAGTSLGTLALAAGSIDDAAAWCVLAAVLATFASDSSIAVWAIGGGIGYVVLVHAVVRPLLARWFAPRVESAGKLTSGMLAFTLCLVMVGSWFTDYIGIYAVFGAFILGTAMPRGLFAKELIRQIEPMVVNFLLPLFFIYSGLNTKLGLVDTPLLWLVTGLVLAAAVLGKGVACWAAARLNGEPQRDALAVGVLMNARGLMELIILNIGLQRGVITPTLFAIMVIMAVVTTLMASPLFTLVHGPRELKPD